MATPVELERLIVRLVMDSKQYENAANNAIIRGKTVGEHLERIGRRVELALENLREHAASVTKNLETPMEKFNRRMANAGALLKTGAINYQQYGRVAQKVQGELHREVEKEFRAREATNRATQRGQESLRRQQERDRKEQIRVLSKAHDDYIKAEEKKRRETEKNFRYLERIRSKYYRDQERELEKAEKFREKQYNRAIRAEQRLAKEAETAARRSYNAWNKSANNIARLSRTAGQGATFGATLPIMGIGGASVRGFAEFDDAMTGSLAVMENVTPRMQQRMEELALTISENSKTSAVDLAEGYYFLASAGYDATQSLDALARVEKFAIAGRFQLQKATELLVDAQTALGMRSRDNTKNIQNLTAVSDVLVKADTIANASVEQFARSLTTKAGNAARLLGKDVYETTAVLAAFAAQGVKAELAGERTYIVWRDLERATRTNAEAFKYFGIQVYDSNGKMRATWDIIRQLETAFAGMSDEEKAATFAQLGFQDRSVAAIKGLIGMSDAMERYDYVLRRSTGYTETVANKQLQSFAAQWQMTLNRLRRVAIDIGELLLPYMKQGIDIVKQWVEWWKALDETQKNQVVRNAAIAASIGPILIGVSKTITAVVALRQAYDGFKAARAAGVFAGLTAESVTLRAALYSLPVAFYAVTKALLDHVAGLEKARQASAVLREEEEKRLGKTQSKQQDWLRQVTAMEDVDAAYGMLEQRLSKQNTQIQFSKRMMDEAKAALDKLNTTFNSAVNTVYGHALLEQAQQEYDLMKKRFDSATSYADDIRDAMQSIHDNKNMAIPNAAGADDDFGGTIPDLKALDKASDSLDRMNESLHTEAVTLGLTANELKVYKMALEGASIIEQKRAMEEARAIDAHEAEVRLWKEMSDAAEKALSPYEKFSVEVAKLNELWAAGMISVAGYKYEYAKLREEMYKGLDSRSTSSSISGMLAGSSEGISLVEDFKLRAMTERDVLARAAASPDLAPEFRDGSTVTGFGRGFDAKEGEPGRLEALLEEIAVNTRPEKMHAGKRVAPVEIDWANLDSEG